jgi:hypothetical protein
MEAAVNDRLSRSGAREEAFAFLYQARDFYMAAATRVSANPLLYYYAFLNLGKALLLVRGAPSPLAAAQHGLSEQYSGTGADPNNSKIVVKNITGNSLNVYTALMSQLGYVAPTPGTQYSVTDLFAQAPVGHRLWREATGRKERFVGVESTEIAQDTAAKTIWLRLYFSRADLGRYGITHQRLLNESGLNASFGEVVSPREPERLICLEQTVPQTYSGRPTDSVMNLVSPMRSLLWRIVTTLPPGYRKNYVYLRPSGGQAVSQIGSSWLLFYYLGSVVRYRPHLFAAISRGKYGAFLSEFIAAQPEQFLYLLASEMRQREVARGAII